MINMYETSLNTIILNLDVGLKSRIQKYGLLEKIN